MNYDYKVDGKEYSMMSPTNERILNKLVNNEVYCNMTQETEFIINALLEGANDSSAPFDVNDYDTAIENGMEHVCEDCGVCDDFEDYDPMEADETDFHGEDWDPEEPVYTCPVCGLEYKTLQEARECCSHEDCKRCNNCGRIYGEYDFGELDKAQPEIYEWYAVSDRFGEKLGQYGEVVIDAWGKSYWGRQGTGQSIICDYVIEQIAYDLEILEGQRYSWEDRVA